jgi:short-subunit dehydrogenase
MNDTLRLELADTDIHVVTLNTGPVKSNFRKNAIKKFQQHVNTAQSVFAHEYHEQMHQHRQKKSDPFTRSSAVVIKNVRHALGAKKPKSRYYNTEATWILATCKRFLPTSWLDAILLRV